MDVYADRRPRLCWALQHVRSGAIASCTLVESEQDAKRLLLGFEKHLPHKGKHKVVPIMLTVEAA